MFHKSTRSVATKIRVHYVRLASFCVDEAGHNGCGLKGMMHRLVGLGLAGF